MDACMFKVTHSGTNRLDISLSGKMDSKEMNAVLDELANKARDIENGTLLYEITDFHFPTLGAIAVEFSRLPEMIKLMKKFKRAAVLADKTWLKKVSELEGAFFPGLEVKAFNWNQKLEAEAWLLS